MKPKIEKTNQLADISKTKAFCSDVRHEKNVSISSAATK